MRKLQFGVQRMCGGLGLTRHRISTDGVLPTQHRKTLSKECPISCSLSSFDGSEQVKGSGNYQGHAFGELLFWHVDRKIKLLANAKRQADISDLTPGLPTQKTEDPGNSFESLTRGTESSHRPI